MTENAFYNSKILLVFINLVKTKYPTVDPLEVMKYAGVKPYEVNDEAHWFTQAQVDRFIERLVQLTGNSDIAREGGRFAGSMESMNLVGKYVLGLLGPANLFYSISKATANFTKASSYRSRRIGSNKVEITVTPAAGVQEKPYQCENRFGYLEAVLTVFNQDLPEIEHPECIFHGDPHCRYIVTWKMSRPTRIRTARNWGFFGALASCAAAYPHYPSEVLLWGSPLLSLGWLAATSVADYLEKAALYATMSNLKKSTDELMEQADVKYNNAVVVNEVGQAISKQAGKEEVLNNIIKVLEHRLGFDRGLILLADDKRNILTFHTGYGYNEDELSLVTKTCFNLANPDSQGVFVRCFKDQKPVLVNDFAEIAAFHSPQSAHLALRMGVKSFICCPIVCEGESLGILAVDNLRTTRGLLASDLSLLSGIAPMIGMSIRNAIYLERERVRAEQMRQSQKMEAIGELAGGVAHDFNNLLTAIIGFTTLAQMATEKESRSYPYLRQVLLASDRATHLTRGLLAFSRKKALNPQPADLNVIVGEMRALLRRLISAEIELKFALDRRPLVVMADPGQIDQILLNLTTNARDAMEDAGVLTIETSLAEPDAQLAEKLQVPAGGRYARLAVRDSGKGMDEATRAHIFEPFFTTKEPGKGTGLGLAIVYGIVKQHHGTIQIVSAPGNGTSFDIYLPLHEGVAPVVAAPAAVEHSFAGTETILVVEDAAEVRKLTSEVLEQQGYRVIEAVDGRDGLAKFMAHQEEIKLVIMDVVMPKMNGKEAFAAIAEVKPDLKVLFTSGYTPDDVSRKGVQFDRRNFLPKPAPPLTLLRMVRELLNEK
jgi:signal transduction histidine kinase